MREPHVRLGHFQLLQQCLGGGLLRGIAAEDGVEEAGLVAVAIAFGLFHCFKHCGVRRNAVQHQQLIQAQPQEDLDGGALLAAIGLARNQPVQRSFPPDTSVGQFLGEATIVCPQCRLGAGFVQEVFDEGPTLHPAQQHAGGHFATGGKRCGRSFRTALLVDWFSGLVVEADDPFGQMGGRAIRPAHRVTAPFRIASLITCIPVV